MSDVYALIDATWPPAGSQSVGGWTIREGQGGGSRVSAATWDGGGAPGDIARAEAAMRDLAQTPLFMIRAGETVLDEDLAARGYAIKDPVTLYAAEAADLAAKPPPVTCFETWPPLAIQAEIWAEGGIGPSRLAVMDRVAGPKTSLFGRITDKPAGSAFVAVSGEIAIIHALEIKTEYRRKGLARVMMQCAADWALRQGAPRLALMVTVANQPANQLYSSLKFKPVGHYHYRIEAETA